MPANAPTNLVLTPSGTSITLTWDSNTPVTPPIQAYDAEIFRSTDGGSTFIHIWTTTAIGTGVTWTDRFLYNSTTYYYKVRQTLPDGVRSAFSSTQNAATAASASAPAAPVIDFLQASGGITSASVDIFFTVGPDSGTRYILERCSGTGCSGFVPALERLPGTNKSGNYHYVTSYTTSDQGDYTPSGVTFLNKCTYYRYRAIAVNSTGNSAYSNQMEIQTPCDVNVPLDPFGLTATTISSSQIDLAWNDNSSNELGFIVERSIYDVFLQQFSTFQPIVTLDSDVEVYSNTGLLAATTYRYRVKAFNSNGDSGYSNIATATTSAGSVAIIAPTNLVGVVETGPQVKLTWSQTSTNETGFKVERADSGGTFVVIATLGANVVTYTDVLVTNGTTYQYRVFAFNATDTSAYAGPITVSVSSGGLTGNEYGIEQFYGANNGFNHTRFLSRSISIVNNTFYNNGLGNIDPDLTVAQNSTIDNPQSESLWIRRGVVLG